MEAVAMEAIGPQGRLTRGNRRQSVHGGQLGVGRGAGELQDDILPIGPRGSGGADVIVCHFLNVRLRRQKGGMKFMTRRLATRRSSRNNTRHGIAR